MQEFNETKFDVLMKTKRSAVIMFSAPWCGACKLVTPIFQKIADSSKNDIVFAKIDVGKENALASKMGVMSIPNIIFIKEGKVIDQLIGNTSEKILLAKIDKL